MIEVVLPGMDGLELTTRVRERCPDLPVLYMVGEDQLSDTVRQGVTDTRNAYLMKPFDDDYLLLRVRAALQAGRSQRTAVRKSRVCYTDPFFIVPGGAN